jgi:hypothetical protein
MSQGCSSVVEKGEGELPRGVAPHVTSRVPVLDRAIQGFMYQG